MKNIETEDNLVCKLSEENYWTKINFSPQVQTEDQYIFIHDALLEAVMAGASEVQARNLHAHIQKLMQAEPGDNVTGMELEFKVSAILV